jgi:hypothetical protein
MTNLTGVTEPRGLSANVSVALNPVRRVRVRRVPDGQMAEVELKDGATVLATLAVPAGEAVVPGDEGLIARDEDGEVYLTAVIRRGSGRSDAGRPAGLSELRDRDGRLIATHDSANNVTRIVQVTGDLDIAAPAGRLRLRSGHGVEIDGPRLTVRSAGIGVESRSLDVDTDRARLTADRATVVSRKLQMVVERSVSSIKSPYQSVTGVLLSRAGRMKITSEGACDLHGGKVYLRSSAELRVLGRKIHLG